MQKETETQSPLRRLATTLLYARQVSANGDELVELIGDDRSKTNIDAVKVWILRQLRHPDPDVARRLIPLLIERFEQETAMQTNQVPTEPSRQLQVGASVSGCYTLMSPTWRYAQNGNPYLLAWVELGRHRLPLFGWPPQCAGCTSIHGGEPVSVHMSAEVESLNGRYQLRCRRLAAATPPSTPTTQWVMTRLRVFNRVLETATLRQFLRVVFSHPGFMSAFLNRPASCRHHHAWPGGLAYHSTEVAWNVFQALCHDPQRQAIATLAALLHDVGKMETLSDSGRLTAKGASLSHDALTLEVLAEPLAWLDAESPSEANLLRELLADNPRNRKENELRSLIRMEDRRSACLD